MTPFKTIAIIGLGLIGGSLAKLIRELHPTITLIGIDPNESTREQALSEQTLDASYTTLQEMSEYPDLAIVATPIDRLTETINELSQHCNAPLFITDTGSIKSGIKKQLKLRDSHTYLGGHPMAGTENQGYAHADADIIRGATYILEPIVQPQHESLATFLKDCGFKLLHIDPATHDRILAAASHLPYLMACLTTQTACDFAKEYPAFQSIISSGFRDTTRVASSSPGWGASISKFNQSNLVECLENVKKNTEALLTIIKERPEEAEALFSEIAKQRNTLYH